MALAKTTRPRAKNAIIRQRLFLWLDGNTDKSVIWVWAPPGAGKTMLIGSYLASRKLNHLWFQVDEGDSDLSSFFYFLRLAAPKRRRAMPLLTPEFRQNVGVFTRNFFRELYERLKTPFTIVFDNYQEVSAEAELNQIMPVALTELPEDGRAIFISRNEPPPSFAKLRADQAMGLLAYPELKFTEPESIELIHTLSPNKWSDSKITELYKHSDGWAAGLVLLVQQLRDESRTVPQKQTSQVVFNYFANEVFSRADEATKDVLLQTAFLPQVSADVAEKLTEKSEAAQVLATHHKRNYFTYLRSGPVPTYEYHPLFREFLLSQAERQYSPHRRTEIRRKSANLLKEGGQVEAAASLLGEAKAWPELTELICKQAQEFLSQGRVETVEYWISGIPEAWVDQNPWLLLWRGTCRLGRLNEACRVDCEKALASFRKHRDATGAYLAWATIVSAHELDGSPDRAVPCALVFDELSLEFPGFPSAAVEASVAHALGEIFLSTRPRDPKAEYWIGRAVELARQQGDTTLQALSAHSWWLYYWMLGDHRKAALVVESAAHLMRDSNASTIAQVMAGLVFAAQQYLRADPRCHETIGDHLDRVDQLGLGLQFKNIFLTVGLASVLSAGDLAYGARWVEENKEGLNSSTPIVRFCSIWTTIWAGLLRNEINEIRGLLPDLLEFEKEVPFYFDHWICHLLAAAIYHRLDETAEAEAHLNKVLQPPYDIQSPYAEFLLRMARAEIYFDTGRNAEGLEALRIGMALGRAGDYVTSSVWIPAVMAKLCAKVLEAGIEVDYVQMLVRKRNLMPEEPPLDIDAWPWPIKIYTLGQFQVLKDDQPLRFSHKVQRKPLALLKTIIALGAQKVREEILLDTLWPESEGDAARFALNSAIHRLRTLLGHEDAIIRQDNEVALNLRRCWLDLVALERLLEKAEAISDQDEETVAEKIQLINRAAKLYQGPFLGDDPESNLGNRTSDRLRHRLVRLLARAGQRWESRERLPDAIQSYDEALRIDPCAEDICRQLMTAYHRLGRPSEVTTAYRSCREALQSQIGTQPSAETDRLLSVLLGK